MASTIEQQRDAEKRELRSAIGRSRRRIDRRLRETTKAAERLASWKTYARRWPGLMMATGLGVGWIAAMGLRPRFLIGLFGARMVKEMSARVSELLSSEVKRFWDDSTPPDNRAGGGGDG